MNIFCFFPPALLFAVLLLVTSAGQSAVLTDNLQTTATPPPPPPTDSPLTTQLIMISKKNSPNATCWFVFSFGMHSRICPLVCSCTTSYSGHRCMLFTGETYILPENEQLIAIGFGVIMLIFFLWHLTVSLKLYFARKLKVSPRTSE
uniref:EGF-like domain-containing protein n=1 Tax=Amphiprion percula TaxID=161767 RepID=A0A3P8T7G3_AMPPE